MGSNWADSLKQMGFNETFRRCQQHPFLLSYSRPVESMLATCKNRNNQTIWEFNNLRRRRKKKVRVRVAFECQKSLGGMNFWTEEICSNYLRRRVVIKLAYSVYSLPLCLIIIFRYAPVACFSLSSNREAWRRCRPMVGTSRRIKRFLHSWAVDERNIEPNSWSHWLSPVFTSFPSFFFCHLYVLDYK